MDVKFLNLKFESGNKTLNIEKDSDYKLIKIEGLESSDYEVNIEQNNNYDGGYINKKRVLPRDVFIEVDYKGLNKELERQKLIGFFNPKQQGILTTNYCGIERFILYEVESFKAPMDNLYAPLNFKVDLVCPDPYLKDYITGEEISTWIGGWKFKFKLPFRFKQKGETKKNIYNSGHVETPMEVRFKGPAVNPSVINHTTREFIKVNRELTSDDTLYITTGFGNKKVEIEREGKRVNAFNYIDLDSTFFSLVVGDNLMEYTTESLEPQSVEIRYRNRYLGV
ncbi:phage tail domain-containing protein [Clostridium sp. KNHs214]|uniref:phage distal tail protein n=1 Tax=Clostridium sp. KNHs214 TaxID=1540257 RepID=UPI0005570F25|nr:phage tail domain-containing protein [Clostridium sp. KNHs214]